MLFGQLAPQRAGPPTFPALRCAPLAGGAGAAAGGALGALWRGRGAAPAAPRHATADDRPRSGAGRRSRQGRRRPGRARPTGETGSATRLRRAPCRSRTPPGAGGRDCGSSRSRGRAGYPPDGRRRSAGRCGRSPTAPGARIRWHPRFPRRPRSCRNARRAAASPRRNRPAAPGAGSGFRRAPAWLPALPLDALCRSSPSELCIICRSSRTSCRP